jgi:putative hydrolase of the HAD superfamily
VDGDLRVRDGGARTQAVIFDLYETLVDYDEARSHVFTSAAADLLGRETEEFHRVWRTGRAARNTGPLAPYLSSLELDDETASRVIALRRETTRTLLQEPRDGVIETLRELRRRGIRTGLITVCSEDTADVWAETPFAGLFDAEVFSSEAGMCKPDRRIYELACVRLGVEPGAALFVGDGANDELAGAERAGLRAVMIGDAIPDWPGPRISAIPEILDLV